MDDTHSESDVSLSPSQILERLQVLRQLQLMQRGKLQKQRLDYRETSETSSNITEIVSHFSNSTSYNTFRSLLQSSSDISNDGTPRLNTSDYSQKVREKDLIEGVSVLNLSQESEFIVSSPLSSRSRVSAFSKGTETSKEYDNKNTKNFSQNTTQKSTVSSAESSNAVSALSKKEISLDDMPILSPRKNFEALLLEKLQNEKTFPKVQPKEKTALPNRNKKPFLRRGEGIARFGLKKNAIIIQNTKSLPWKKKGLQAKHAESPLKQTIKQLKKQGNTELPSEPGLLVPEFKLETLTRKSSQCRVSDSKDKQSQIDRIADDNKQNIVDKNPEQNRATNKQLNSDSHNLPMKLAQKIEFRKNKHPLVTSKGKTWAAVLTKEQSNFLQQLKQSEYYKNFGSPTKSIISNASCDETMSKLRLEREMAEQNLFELLENKVSHDSFNLENSFFNRFLKRSNLEYSGESTPLVMQKCLSENPDLMHILPGLNGRKRNDNSYSDTETCCSNTDCCSDACSSVSCCSCKTVEQNTTQNCAEYDEKNKKSSNRNNKKVKISKEVDNINQDDTITENDIDRANMVEMNAKLVATSELLKDRLHELEDEIQTFRKENANLAKLRDEVDQDRQKFYEEKAVFEQKLNEDKVLAEYYLAEEKEKLSKQKQMYERYVREMRGRLNKKDKDEVVNLKKEINDLKEEIRVKDVKSTSTIARLRNQIKLMEKEKKELQDEVEKLKKQNRRIQHSNEVTRRLTNIKYLEEINKKLTNISNKDTRSEVSVDRDVKYKAYEIERQSRSRKVAPDKGTVRPRAKSVPNLNVTSRYAKYFSQRDVASQRDDIILNADESNSDDNINISNEDLASTANDDYLEKMYMERFSSNSPKSNRSSDSNSKYDNTFMNKPDLNENTKNFFIQKSNSNLSRNSKSPKRTSNLMNDKHLNRSNSPISISSNKSSNKLPNATFAEYSSNHPDTRSKSPVSAFNHSSLRSATVIHNQYGNKLSVSPEPSMTRTTLNPTESRNSDGSRELRFPNGNVKYISADGTYSKFVYYNGDVKENFYNEGRIKYYYAETKTYHTTHADGLEVLEFPDGQVEKRYKDGSSEIRLPNGSVRYFDPKNEHVREEWRFPDGAALTVAANGERRVVFSNGQVEVHAKDHKRREFPDGTVKLVYNDGTSETRYASGRVRIKDKHGNLIMDSAPG